MTERDKQKAKRWWRELPRRTKEHWMKKVLLQGIRFPTYIDCYRLYRFSEVQTRLFDD